MVNPGGAGPRSKPSPTFRTLTSYPVQMDPVGVESTGVSSIHVFWPPLDDWNDRGGLEITTYVLFMREEGQPYTTGELVYVGSEFEFRRLPSNTKFYFAIVAENTECTTCPVAGSCFFPLCCDDHTCTPKSVDSEGVSTLPGKMTTPFIDYATLSLVRVGWPTLPGTPNNVWMYRLRYRDIDRGSQEATGEWKEVEFAGAAHPTSYTLAGLNPNNRYEVAMSANNGFGYGAESDTATLATKAGRVTHVRLIDVRATEISLAWEAPPGRRNNIAGFNITYRPATPAEAAAGAALESLPLQHVVTPSNAETFAVVQLAPNTSYVFQVAAINGGGLGEPSSFTAPATTMARDLLAACRMYALPVPRALPLQPSIVGAELLIQESSDGSTTMQGALRGLAPGAAYRIESRQFGASLPHGLTGAAADTGESSGVVHVVSNHSADTDGAVRVDMDVALSLTGAASLVGRSLALVDAATGAALAQCEVGLARPRSGAFLNNAAPAAQTRGFCQLIPREGLQLRGGFIVAPTDRVPPPSY